MKKVAIILAVTFVGLLTQTAFAKQPALHCNRFAWGCATPAEKALVQRTIVKHFGSGWLGRMMIRCARRESGFNPYASNFHDSNGGSYGALQINGIHARGNFTRWRWRMYNVENNVQQAVALYRGGGISHWGGGC